MRTNCSSEHNRTSHIVNVECSNVHNWLTIYCGVMLFSEHYDGRTMDVFRNSRDETDLLDHRFSFIHIGPYFHPKTFDHWTDVPLDQWMTQTVSS